MRFSSQNKQEGTGFLSSHDNSCQVRVKSTFILCEIELQRWYRIVVQIFFIPPSNLRLKKHPVNSSKLYLRPRYINIKAYRFKMKGVPAWSSGTDCGLGNGTGLSLLAILT